MKQFKRILALVLAMTMFFALSVTAMADGEGEGGEEPTPALSTEPTPTPSAAPTKNNSITVNNAIAGETYNLYKLFDLVVDNESDPTAFSYTIHSDWADFFKAADSTTDPATPAGPGYACITVNEAGYVTAISDAAALAKAAAAWSDKPAALQTKTVAEGGTTATFTDLEDGYYLVTSTLGTVAMTETTPAKEAVAINEKNPQDTIEKFVKEDSTEVYGEENDAQVGDLVEFKSIARVEPHSRNVKIHDTMSEGLTFTSGSIKIYTDAALETEFDAANYTIQDTPDAGDTFTIQINDSYVDGLSAASVLYITYTATLNEKAIKTTATEEGETVPAIVDQTNSTSITFGNSQSVEDQTTTTTHKFEIKKHNADGVILADAKFKLYVLQPAVTADPENGIEAQEAAYVEVSVIKIDDNNYRVAVADETGVEIVTVSEGNIVIWGVDSDIYYLEETEAPAGYNKLTDKVTVTVNEENSFVSDILNNSGTELPSTGGIGTRIFYIVGGILVAGAVVLLITRRRMNDKA